MACARTKTTSDSDEDQFISQICQSLSLEESETESLIIAKQLLINGRQELRNHRENITPMIFDSQMSNEGNSELLNILESYFEQQWQRIPFDWFKKFITKQKAGGKNEHYQRVLTRTADDRNKYMKYIKECHVFFIVLQLIFSFNNDMTVLDDIWNSFLIYGYEIALKKWKKSIVSTVKKEQLHSQDSPLFQALREYFRELVNELFVEHKIKDKENCLEITVNCLANDGWIKGLDHVEIKQRVTPAKYTALKSNLGQLLERKGISLPVINPPPAPAPISVPSSDKHIVYVCNLPVQITDNHELEQEIRQCLKRKYKQDIVDIECNAKLGIGKIYLKNDNEKNHLVNGVQSIILSSKGENIIIEFSSDLELMSYIVIDSTNKDDLPPVDKIVRSWRHFYKVKRPKSCEPVSSQFRHVFRIVSDSLDEIIHSVTDKEFPIDDLNANVYFQADCCFLEDLPENTSINKLRQAITDQISRDNISKETCYIQYNQKSANAIVLSCGRARQWSQFDSINVDGQEITKKTKLSNRLVLYPVPKDFHIPSIVKHGIFKNTVIQTVRKEDRLIVELSDQHVYDECVKIGAVRVDDQFFHVEIYSPSPDNDKHKGDNEKRPLSQTTVMSNTIGVVRKGSYYVHEREIKLNEDQLKTVVYNHQSTLQPRMTMPLEKATRLQYISTQLEVVDKTCLNIYEKLVAQKSRPVLLHMTDNDSPGCEKENLYYRSNYFRSLDTALDNGIATNRFYCDANCQCRNLSERQRLYPIDEFGAIYTSGITVFRQDNDTGYAFMNEPLTNVCIITMTTYPNPKVENNRLASKFSIGMRKKIENFFAIAYDHQHDCVIVPAFKNVSEQITTIFLSVIEQYAGFFKYIYFSSVNDRLSEQILHNKTLKPKQNKRQNMTIGPRRILNMSNPEQVTLSDIKILYLTPCQYGGQCNDLYDSEHSRKYLHPPLCPSIDTETKCKSLNDDDHRLWFIHRTTCPHGGECPLLLDDEKHADQFEHPKYCYEEGFCGNTTSEHLKAYQHVPSCKHGLLCRDFIDKTMDHCRKYRHFPQPCRYQQECTDTSHEHRSKFTHKGKLKIKNKIELPRCRHNLKCRDIRDPQHCMQFSHDNEELKIT